MSPEKIYPSARASERTRLRSFTSPAVHSAVVMLVLIVQSASNSVTAMPLSCPDGFRLGSETSTTLTCVFEQTLQNPPGAGETPTQSTEGGTLIANARAVCRGAEGTPRNVRDIGTTGVAMDCVLDKPEAPPVVTPAPTPSPTEPVTPSPPERIDFNVSSQFQDGTVEASVANSMVNICNGFIGRDDLTPGQQDLLERCRDIDSESNGSLQLDAVQKVAARQYGDLANLINFQNTIMVGEIGNRLASLREVMSQTMSDVASHELAHPSPGLLAQNDHQRGGSAGDEGTFFSRFGAFAFGARGDGKKSTTDISRGFSYESSSATIGVDYLVNNSTIVGLAFGYGSSDSELFGNGGDIEIRNNNVSLYGSKYFKNGWYIDAIGGMGKVDSLNRRSIDFTANGVTVEQDALGQFDSSQSIISIGGGRSFDGPVTLDVSARLNHIDTAIDRFSETTNPGAEGFGLALEIDSYDLISTTSEISVAASKPFSRSWGVIVPSVTARWLHEFEDGDDVLFGRFLADPNTFDFSGSGVGLGRANSGSTIFTVPLEKVDSDYGNLLIGVTALFPNQLSASFSVNRTIGLDNFDHTYYSLTLRRDFN